MIAGKIMVVDDEPDIRSLIKEILEDENFEVTVAEDATQADNIREEFDPDLILLDIWMPGIDGITLLKQWNESNRMHVPVIMISGHGTVETAVEATRLGAYDFIEKPLSLAKLILTVKHALENTSLQRENIRLKDYNQRVDSPIGKSKVMQNLREKILQIVEHSTPVLITGESGTDKERFARYLHNQSSRSEAAFISVGISALSADNFLMEFFGSEEADKDRSGFFEQAEGGTLFLKDIADMDLSLQAKLQNTLDNKYFTRVGSTKTKAFDIRIIAATNHDLLKLVNEGLFRDDLYYQLNILPIHIPPLCEHTEDIPELLEFYVDYFADREGLAYRHFTVAAQNQLRSYSWPGNVRELKNMVQRLLILGTKENIDIDELDLARGKVTSLADEQNFIPDFDMPLREARERFEKEYLQHKLIAAGGSVSKVAEAVGMERTHLYRKLKSLGITIKNQDSK
ncbi:MAG: sigma-54-dependent Fis family transcriptional regulator [Gammaproteobacteria bacterium]|nr:MAG: sigma-54-dependent Fis family transcriptional regulator [Gammaproteobacteria bacterium]RKZ71369.1 MAG: sigma-54-dependent Fis family transcriptional regulator [Gammaproteobacteria bacterium]